MTDTEHPFARFVRILGKGKTGSRSLDREEAFESMRMILNGEAEPVQIGAFLMLLRVKEESHLELSGFVSAVRAKISPPAAPIPVDLDWSSYAGKKRQLPWYLLACFMLADQGIRIVMHGAGGHTAGRLYTEQVLAQLGIATATDWQQVSEQLDTTQFSFMPLQHFCPELQQIINLRSQLGLRSPVHTLSRLLNPLAAPCSMQSIFHPAYGHNHQQAALDLGQASAAVFKGEGGEIERRPEADCTVKRVENGKTFEEHWPRLLQGRQPQPEKLDPDQLIKVWRGSSEDNYGHNAIIGTAAIALCLLGKAKSQQEALTLATQYWQERNRDRI